jgi:hypothetical protein
MRETCKSGSEGGGIETNRCLLPLSRLASARQQDEGVDGRDECLVRGHS